MKASLSSKAELQAAISQYGAGLMTGLRAENLIATGLNAVFAQEGHADARVPRADITPERKFSHITDPTFLEKGVEDNASDEGRELVRAMRKAYAEFPSEKLGVDTRSSAPLVYREVLTAGDSLITAILARRQVRDIVAELKAQGLVVAAEKPASE